jgi:hypothetical protein
MASFTLTPGTDVGGAKLPGFRTNPSNAGQYAQALVNELSGTGRTTGSAATTYVYDDAAKTLTVTFA